MKIKSILEELENLAPLSLQESYDNSGLQMGDPNDEFKAALFCLDVTIDVVNEAVEKGCNLIISHHPVFFSPIKQLNFQESIPAMLKVAVLNEISIYSIHTNLDNVHNGVNHEIANRLGLINQKVLKPKGDSMYKLVYFCPTKEEEKVRAAVFKAGGGNVGNYDSCSFSQLGSGSFRAKEGAEPHIGEVGKLHKEEELRVEIILPKQSKSKVIRALLTTHPYEEVAYDLYELDLRDASIGSGMVGDLPQGMGSEKFLQLIKETFNVKQLRYTKIMSAQVNRVALCGGSGSFLLEEAIQSGADLFLSADFKYHQFFEADEKITIADIGHFETEQYTGELLQAYLKEKFPNFASYLTSISTNPINYL